MVFVVCCGCLLLWSCLFFVVVFCCFLLFVVVVVFVITVLLVVFVVCCCVSVVVVFCYGFCLLCLLFVFVVFCCGCLLLFLCSSYVQLDVVRTVPVHANFFEQTNLIRSLHRQLCVLIAPSSTKGQHVCFANLTPCLHLLANYSLTWRSYAVRRAKRHLLSI